jgi:hypothetical protein
MVKTARPVPDVTIPPPIGEAVGPAFPPPQPGKKIAIRNSPPETPVTHPALTRR